MRLVDIVLDAAALLRAARSVAAKHAALRAQQWDTYRKTSGVLDGLRKTEAQAQEHLAPQQEPIRSTHTSHVGSAIMGRGVSNPALSSVRHTVEPASKVSTGSEIRSRRSPAPSPIVPPIPSDEPMPDKSAKTDEEEYNVPPGVDINVFRTSRGSTILGNLAKKQDREPPQYPVPWSRLPASRPIELQPSGKVYEHRAQEETPPANEPPRAPQPEADTVNGMTQAAGAEKSIPNLAPEVEQKPAKPSRALEPEAVKADSVDDIAPAAAAEESIPNPLGGKPYVLRESKVPATRMSRIWNYSGLAAGMLGGAITEGFSRTFGGGGQGSLILSGANMERLVSKLSRMRGAALKLGQMMSFQDSKMLPGPIQEVLQRVQDRADYMPSYQRDQVLVSNLGSEWRDLFTEFEEKPIAAASIGQVHRATLKSGKNVAVKIQFPGVADSINSDLDNLSILLTATKLLPKGLYLNKTIDNARTELGWECDYEREAQCLVRFKKLMAGEEDVFLVPDVHPEASGKQVLTMDFMDGLGVTRIKSFTQKQRDWIGTQILRLCLREIAEFRFMQTDPNWTNFLYNERLNKLALLDFGASREYPDRFVDLYVRLLEAASRSDRGGVKNLSEDLGYLTGHESSTMLNAHVNSVLTLAEPFMVSAPDVYDFKDQTITERVKALIPVMLRERLAPPPEETYSLHRKLSGAFLLCARLGSRVACKDLFVKSLDKAGIPCGKTTA